MMNGNFCDKITYLPLPVEHNVHLADSKQENYVPNTRTSISFDCNVSSVSGQVQEMSYLPELAPLSKTSVSNSNNICPSSNCTNLQPELMSCLSDGCKGNYVPERAPSSTLISLSMLSNCPNYTVAASEASGTLHPPSADVSLAWFSDCFQAYTPYYLGKAKTVKLVPRDENLLRSPLVLDVIMSLPVAYNVFISTIGEVWNFHRFFLSLMPGADLPIAVTAGDSQPEPKVRSAIKLEWAPLASKNLLWFSSNAALCLGRRCLVLLFTVNHHIALCPIAYSFETSFALTESSYCGATNVHIPILSCDWSVHSCTQTALGCWVIKAFSLQKPLFDEPATHELFLNAIFCRTVRIELQTVYSLDYELGCNGFISELVNTAVALLQPLMNLQRVFAIDSSFWSTSGAFFG